MPMSDNPPLPPVELSRLHFQYIGVMAPSTAFA